MILTDKAKIKFEKWFYKKFHYVGLMDIEEMPDLFQNAIIIEWLDSVGICVTILVCVDLKFDAYITTKERRKEVSQFNKTRQEATTKAIEKANQIFNNI